MSGSAGNPKDCNRDVWLLQRSEVAGGTQRIILELAARLSEQGVAARAVFLRDLREHRHAQRSKVAAVAAHFRDLWRLLSGLRRDRPAVVVTFTPLLGAIVGLLSKMSRRYRVVSTLHMSRWNISSVVCLVDRLAARSGGYVKVVACGQAVADSFSKSGNPYPMPITVIANGVPVMRTSGSLRKNSALRRFGPACAGQSVAFAAGRLAKEKNYLFLIEVFALLTEWHLVIAGDGSERAGIEAAITRLGLAERVTLAGLLSPQEVSTWLSECDAYVLPSVNEGLSLALLEAMASASPILASDIPGNREALGDEPGEFGWLLPPDDREAWSDKLRMLRVDPQAGRAAGARAQKRQREVFSQERMYTDYTRLILDVLVD